MDLAIDTPVTETKSERLASLREQTAEARSGITRWQRQKLVEWWTQFHGEPPGPDISAEQMAEKFLSPPPQWARGTPLGYVAVALNKSAPVIRNGRHIFLDDGQAHAIGGELVEITQKVEGVEIEYAVNLTAQEAPGLIGGKNVIALPCLSVQVLRHAWKRPLDAQPLGVRGQLLLLRGSSEDMAARERFLLQAIEAGDVRIVADQGRYSGRLEDLGACPTPTPRDPAGRTYLSGYKGAAGKGEAAATKRASGPRDHEPVPRTLDALLPEPPRHIHIPEWHETPMVRVVPNADLHIEYFDLFDQKEAKVPEWLACVLSCRKTRHGEPYVNWVDAPSEPGRRFRAAVESFVAANPAAMTDSPGFPIYSLV